MSNTFTAGPYGVFPLNDRLQRYAVVCLNEQQCPGRGKMVLANHVRTEANARLFAAAPAMFDLLAKLARSGDWYTSALEIDTYAGFDGWEMKDELDAILASVTGA